MSEPTPLDTDDLAAFATAFALSLFCALEEQGPNGQLERLALELRGLAKGMQGTAAGEAIGKTIAMLDASDPAKRNG